MRYLTLAALVCLVVGSGSVVSAQTADPQMMAPINKFMETFNKGDMAGAAATHAADVVIIDEVPPFIWRGPKAFQNWASALDADAKKQGMTEPQVTIKAATRTESDGTTAYVIVPATFRYLLKGVAMTESAQMTFILKKEGAGWLIHGWTWSGTKPVPATP